MEPFADPPRLFVVVGLPGSGKTTIATGLARAYRAALLSGDAVMVTAGIDTWDGEARARIEANQRAEIPGLLAARRSVVVEWGTWWRAERDALLAIGRHAGARVELHVLDAPIDELHRRATARDRESPAITLDQLRQWHDTIDWPDADELAGYDNARPLRASTLTDHFDGDTASSYDDVHIADSSIDAAVDVLASLAEETPVWGVVRACEFAIGTGRIAIPLAARGVEVSGIDISAAMLAQLSAKPTAAGIDARQGEMATTFLAEHFGVVYLVFNTIMNLTSQAEQRSCFANAAAHLAPGGRFVVEVVVPELAPGGTDARVVQMDDGHIGVDQITDAVDQQLTSHHYWFDGRSHHASMPFRYVWPSELDLMAELAGLHLEHRWADWDRSEFRAESPFHVSVWRRPS